MNEDKVQGPSLSIKFLDVIWLGKTRSMTVRQLQAYVGLLGFWQMYHT